MAKPKQFNIHEAKTQFSRLIASVERGEEVIIARAGVPVAKLTRMTTTPTEREPGRYRGRIRVSDDFDAPLPEDLLTEFEA